MEWVIESYDRRTDRDGQNRFTTEVAFIRAGDELLRNSGRGFVSADPRAGPEEASAHRRRPLGRVLTRSFCYP
jgi:hypothetical protein